MQKVDSDKYHIQRNDKGTHSIIWTSPEEPPEKIWGLVAVKPKPPQTFLGLPLTLVNTVIAGSIGLLTGLLAALPNKQPPVKPGTISQVSESQLSSIDDLKVINEELMTQLKNQNDEVDTVIKLPSNARILYLFGKSHGTREQVIRHYFEYDDALKNLALNSEETYVRNMLGADADSWTFEEGKAKGRKVVQNMLDTLETNQLLEGNIYGK
ncbi:MAG: hypothetical protein ACMZ64_09140 [Oleiphilus sp.]